MITFCFVIIQLETNLKYFLRPDELILNIDKSNSETFKKYNEELRSELRNVKGVHLEYTSHFFYKHPYSLI